MQYTAVFLPIEGAIIANSRNHNHTIGSKLPHLTIKKQNNNNY